MIESAVILATGSPKHSSQLSPGRAPAMLPALGKPMIARVMEPLYRAGIRRYFIIVGLNEGSVASYLNTHWMPDTDIEFVLQSGGNSLTRVLQNLARKIAGPFLLTSYNSFTYERFITTLLNFHEEYPQHLIITGAHSTLSHGNQHKYARMEGQLIEGIGPEAAPQDEPHYIMAELGVCGHAFIGYLMERAQNNWGVTDFVDVARQYLEADSEELDAVIAEASWILQVETDRDLLTLNRLLLDDVNDAHLLSELPTNVRIHPPVRIDPQVSVGQGAVIGPHVYLERGSQIGSGATIRNAIVLERAIVQPKQQVHDTIVGRKGPVI